MLNFIDAKMPEDELKAAYDTAKKDKTIGITPLDYVQERVMENVLGHVVDHFTHLAELIDEMPLAYTEDPAVVLNLVCAQITARAMEDGLLLPIDDSESIEEGIYGCV